MFLSQLFEISRLMMIKGRWWINCNQNLFSLVTFMLEILQ